MPWAVCGQGSGKCAGPLPRSAHRPKARTTSSWPVACTFTMDAPSFLLSLPGKNPWPSEAIARMYQNPENCGARAGEAACARLPAGPPGTQQTLTLARGPARVPHLQAGTACVPDPGCPPWALVGRCQAGRSPKGWAMGAVCWNSPPVQGLPFLPAWPSVPSAGLPATNPRSRAAGVPVHPHQNLPPTHHLVIPEHALLVLPLPSGISGALRLPLPGPFPTPSCRVVSFSRKAGAWNSRQPRGTAGFQGVIEPPHAASLAPSARRSGLGTAGACGSPCSS